MNRQSPSGAQNIFTAVVTVDPANVGPAATVTTAFAVVGVRTTDTLLAVDIPNIASTLLAISRTWISAADQVSVALINNSVGAVDLASASWTIVWARNL